MGEICIREGRSGFCHRTTTDTTMEYFFQAFIVNVCLFHLFVVVVGICIIIAALDRCVMDLRELELIFTIFCSIGRYNIHIVVIW